MKTKMFISLTFILSLIYEPSLLTAQLSPSKGDYYAVDVTTPKIIYSDDSHSESYSLKAGSTIKIRAIESSRIYFQLITSNKEMKSELLYQINKNDFTEKYFSPKFFVRGGILLTPFKFRPDKSKFYPGGNIAAAGSFTYNMLGIGIQPLFFGGLTAVSITDLNSGELNTETKLGFTTGIGINFDVAEAFNIGFVSGWDIVDSNWESNGKIWLALSFNYKFLD